MKWQCVTLIGRKTTGKDALGNPQTEKTTLGIVATRFSPWTSEETLALGRDLTQSVRRYLTIAPLSTISDAIEAEIDGNVYTVTEIADLGRYRAIYTKGWRMHAD